VSKLAANATLLIALVQAVILLAKAFGVDLTQEQTSAIGAVTTAVLGVIGIYFHPSIPIGPTGTDTK
jgi:uncharacterized membrane protein